VDPAVYFGHREAEFGMITLFGGFDSDFFAGYMETFPLKIGWEERVKFYQLYHLLNHLNLVGNSYYNSIIELLNDLNLS
jgi:fructosamine-3-kinase